MVSPAISSSGASSLVSSALPFLRVTCFETALHLDDISVLPL